MIQEILWARKRQQLIEPPRVLYVCQHGWHCKPISEIFLEGDAELDPLGGCANRIHRGACTSGVVEITTFQTRPYTKQEIETTMLQRILPTFDILGRLPKFDP